MITASTKDIVEQIRKTTPGLTKVATVQVYRNMLQSIIDLLDRYDAVKLDGIGTIKLVDKKARIGRNPKTGESVSVPASTTLKLAVSKSMKSYLNQ